MTFLTPQIPEFEGTEDENIKLWIQWVDKIAQIHRTSDDIMLLAAPNGFVKAARKWFDFDTGSMLESWVGLKDTLIKRFERRIPLYVAMQKIKARKWLFHKETFQEYAMKKLALM